MKIEFSDDPKISLGYPLKPDDMPEQMEDLGDLLCVHCPLQDKGVYSVPGGSVAGCEGSRCKEAYENYLTFCEENQ